MKIGEKSRHTGKTNMNEKSSRSHTIFRITLESTNRSNDADDTMEDAEAGLNCMDICTQSISCEKGRVGGLGAMITGTDPAAMQSVRWVTGTEGSSTRQNVALPSIFKYWGRSGGIDRSKWDGDFERIFSISGSATCW